jgi:pSer/pThr/pTyr-binding forkhead associated (FHA) protein
VAGITLRLHWTDPNGHPQKYEDPLPITLGRHKDNTIQLEAQKISRWHARLEASDDDIVLIDNSSNGTLVNGRRVGRVILENGDAIQIGPFIITVVINIETITEEQTLSDTDLVEVTLADDDELLSAPPVLPSPPRPPFPPPIFDRALVPIEALRAGDLPIDETTYLTIGGGLGSFIWVDYLRICGIAAGSIVALGQTEKPYGNYQRLCLNSQIKAHDRLRSNSESCPDNIWGWPGYGLREMGQALNGRQWRRAAGLGWQLLTEPIFDNTYTPRSGDVFAAIDREAGRIGWPQIWRYGRVRSIRKTADGRYVVAYSQTQKSTDPIHKLMIANYLHLAVGYPAIRLLPDLQAYRQQTGDFTHVVNAYEPHAHVYEQLLEQGGAILLRGRGIVASRILERLYEIRTRNPHIVVIHLLRTPKSAGAHFGRAQRLVENQWEFQRFNWPLGAWGGPARSKLDHAPPDQREKLIMVWGGTTTAKRKSWRHIVQTGLAEGWYRQSFGAVQRVERDEAGALVTVIRSHDLPQEIRLTADAIIDATGLISHVSSHPLLNDLIEHYKLSTTAHHHLEVAGDFELVGLRNGPGRIYTSGIMAQFGYVAIDSFLGLNYAAQRSVERLRQAGAPDLRSLNPIRSVAQWLRWAGGVVP